MKKLLIVLFLFTFYCSFSQESVDFSKIKLEKPADYKEAESEVLRATVIILTSHNEEEFLKNWDAISLFMKWMGGTPDHEIFLDEVVIANLQKEQNNMDIIYLAGTARYCLEHPELEKDSNLVRLHAVKQMLSYCEKPQNKVRMTKYLKALSDADKKGELEAFLEKKKKY